MLLLPLFAAWAVAVISPGPDFLAVLRTAAAHGRHQGVVAGLGVTTAIGCWATLALTGLSILLARYAHLYLVLRTVGAVFLILYGLQILWSTWRSRGAEPVETASPTAAPGLRRSGAARTASSWRSYRLGLATNLSNPKAVLFFGALFASVMPAGLAPLAKVGVVAAMLVMAAAWFSLVAVLAGSPAVMRGYRRAQRAIDAVAGGLFVLVGGALLPR